MFYDVLWLYVFLYVVFFLLFFVSMRNKSPVIVNDRQYRCLPELLFTLPVLADLPGQPARARGRTRARTHEHAHEAAERADARRPDREVNVAGEPLLLLLLPSHRAPLRGKLTCCPLWTWWSWWRKLVFVVRNTVRELPSRRWHAGTDSWQDGPVSRPPLTHIPSLHTDWKWAWRTRENPKTTNSPWVCKLQPDF